ncbi:DNA mismatch repair endonuclease MutL [Lacticaseibacillus thailandensis]|nr:DNA mismatch repair endonuclease MutL [Lacticaseibacillus thailandensis]
MSQIHELPEALANQIAAGEVVERPASVIKELVENSIDAGASQIDIRVADAGLRLMEVADNGAGIEPDDVPAAFKRHATSKIATTRDLFAIHSLGFRGEALASIAAVADVTIETATSEGVGTTAHLTGGQIVDAHQQAFRQGTTIAVHNLFYNTPARLKYVKSQATELSHITDIVNRLALGHPDIAMTLRSGDKLLLRTAGNGDLQQTIAGIYGVATAKAMLAFSGEDLDFKVSGYVSLPDTTRATRTHMTLLLNGRYFKNFNLAKAVIAGYGSKLMVGRYPLAVVNITIDPQLVDVNVHPTKQELRISKEPALAKLIEQTIYARMADQNLIPDALHNLPHRRGSQGEQQALNFEGAPRVHETVTPIEATDRSVRQAMQAGTSSAAAPDPAAAPTPDAASANDYGLDIEELPQDSIMKHPERLAAWDQRYAHIAPDEMAAVDQEDALAVAGTAAPAAAADQPQERFPHLHYLAQMHGTFILAETPDGFYLVDQHAAQERVNYEKYRVEIGQVDQGQQNLLVPIVLDYPASDAALIRDRMDVLHSVGVNLEDFGQNSFVVHSHPTWFAAGQEEDTLREMIDWVLRDGHLTVAKFREAAAIMMSCKRAIKANHHLDAQQGQALLDKLEQAENPFNCPHGRPVVVEFSNKDLNRMFKRIQDSHESNPVDL